MSKRRPLSVRHWDEVPGMATSDSRATGRPRSVVTVRRAIERANAPWERTMYASMRFAHDEHPFWWSRAVVETPPPPSFSVACVTKIRRLYMVSSSSSARSSRDLGHTGTPSRHVREWRPRQCRRRTRNDPVPYNPLFDKANPAIVDSISLDEQLTPSSGTWNISPSSRTFAPRERPAPWPERPAAPAPLPGGASEAEADAPPGPLGRAERADASMLGPPRLAP